MHKAAPGPPTPVGSLWAPASALPVERWAAEPTLAAGYPNGGFATNSPGHVSEVSAKTSTWTVQDTSLLTRPSRATRPPVRPSLSQRRARAAPQTQQKPSVEAVAAPDGSLKRQAGRKPAEKAKLLVLVGCTHSNDHGQDCDEATGSSTAGSLVMATKRSIVDNLEKTAHVGPLVRGHRVNRRS